jgi:hypothetical protein
VGAIVGEIAAGLLLVGVAELMMLPLPIASLQRLPRCDLRMMPGASSYAAHGRFGAGCSFTLLADAEGAAAQLVAAVAPDAEPVMTLCTALRSRGSPSPRGVLGAKMLVEW